MKFLTIMNNKLATPPPPAKSSPALQESFANVLSTALHARALVQNPSVKAATMTIPGIVQLPVAVPSATSKPGLGQGNKKTGSIDIASIVNFNKPGKAAAPKNGELKIFGENPSVVVGSRSQPPANNWERYRMESSSTGSKGVPSSMAGGGVMVSCRIAIG
jgi:hypothetical protein